MKQPFREFNWYNGFVKQSIEDVVERSYTDSENILDVHALADLAIHCPGLIGFDWKNYLYCSKWRVRKTMRELIRLRPKRTTRVLDMGTWLGNFALAAKYLSYNVTACDDWRQTGLEAQRDLLARNAIDCVDRCVLSEGFVRPVSFERFDVVFLMSVIEHIPHTPRLLLKTINRLLKPGGILILDTPNLAYIYNRRRLNRGESIHPPIQEQFISEIPFEGHNREYTFDELVWMLNASGFFVGNCSFYNYSMYGVRHPYLMNARSLVPMLLNPRQRELIFLSAQKIDEL